MPTLEEVRHRRGFLTAIDKAVRTASKLDLDGPALEVFRDEFVPAIRDPMIRAFVADQLHRRIEDHPLRAFTPVQARSIVALRAAHGRGSYPEFI